MAVRGSADDETDVPRRRGCECAAPPGAPWYGELWRECVPEFFFTMADKRMLRFLVVAVSVLSLNHGVYFVDDDIWRLSAMHPSPSNIEDWMNQSNVDFCWWCATYFSPEGIFG